MLPVTGNIYKDRFSYEGKRYIDYSVDCAECGKEVAIFLSFRDGRTCKKWLKNKGWHKHPEHHKWVSGNWVAKMAGLIVMTKTHFGMTKMIPKCVPRATELVLSVGVPNVVMICKGHAQHSVQRTGGESGQQSLFSAGEVLPAKVTRQSTRR